MLTSKTNSSCFSKKIKSPYVLQYLAFEERINAPTKRKNPLIPNLLQPTHQEKPLLDDQNNRTFQQVKEIIKKRNKIWMEEKENMLPTIEDQHLLTLKDKLERIRSRAKNIEQTNTLESQQLSRQQTIAPSTSEAQKRSRAISENHMRPNTSQRKGVINFIQYKRSRRELSIKFKMQ